MFLYRLKSFICIAAATLLCLFIVIGMKAVSVSRLSTLEGDRTFFLDSASSQGLMKKELSISDFLRVKGECVSFSLNDYEGGRYVLSEDIAYSIAEKFDAEILFLERVEGVVSYYCYTPFWQDKIFIEGRVVNLHVAISENECVVGAPIIFGGF